MLKKVFSFLFILSAVVVPHISFAQEANVNINPDSNGNCTAILCNPLGSQNGDLATFLVNLLNQLSKVAAMVAVLMIIYSGFKFVTAQGNETKITAAKNQLLYVIIGTAIVLGADVIVNIVVNTIAGIK